MGKGSSSQPSGNTNPAAAAQLPFLTDAWGEAQKLYQSRPAGQGLNIASEGEPWSRGGLGNQYNAANILMYQMDPTARGAWGTAIGGGYGNANSPAYPYYQALAQGNTPEQGYYSDIGALAHGSGVNYANQIAGYAPQLAANNNLGMSQLGQTASGQYLNGNPYFAQMVQNALDPITRNYQTSIAPQLDATFMNSGRYGSGAMAGQRENAQNTLADQLAKTSSNMYGQNYATERAQQIAAANQYAGLYNQGLTGAAGAQQAAANTLNQGLNTGIASLGPRLNSVLAGTQGMQSGYNTGNQAALTALGQYPALAQAQYLGPQGVVQAGQGINSIQQQYLDEPYSQLTRYLNALGAGNPQQGQGIYSNPTLEAMAGISGGLNLLKQGSGLFGGGTSAASNMVAPAGWIPGTGMGSGIFTNAATGITSDIAGSGFPGLVASAAPAATAGLAAAAPAAWIICTELTRQGRMPRKHWAVGARVFDSYPEIGKRGYYVWAIPTVRHLRRKPYSLYSRLCATVFGWRAEDLAARHGVKGARKLLRGRLVTAVLALPCLLLGAVAPEQNWRSVYVN